MRRDIGRDGADERLAGENDGLPGRLQRRAEPARQVVALGKSRAVQPADLIPDLKPGILDRAGHAVIGACAREGDQVAAGLQDAQHIGPQLRAESDVAAVPLLAHEAARHFLIWADALSRHLLREVALNIVSVG